MTKERLFARAFSLLGDFTPLKGDCGELCSKRCCKGDDGTGMLLFPGEKTNLPVREKNGRRLAVCGGQCEREQRPLSCRLFPLFPVPDAHGGLTAAPDARGGICPLVHHAADVPFSFRFRARVAAVGRLLLRDADCRAFLQAVWDEMEEAAALRRSLTITDDQLKS